MVWANVSQRGARLDAPRLLDLAERSIFVIALAVSFYLNLRSRDPTNISLLANNLFTTVLLLFRRRASAVSTSPLDWTVAVIGTAGGMLMRPGDAPPLVAVAPALVISVSGFLIQLLAKLSLNRRFGIGPANRGIQDRWAYGVIRHPMYFGYLLIQAAYLLRNPSPLNLAIFTVTWACQFARILREEHFLLGDLNYRRYASRVRYRLLPLVF